MLNILHEDNHLIAVNKPTGLLVHGDKTGDRTLADLVKAYIKKKYNKPGDVFLGVIHRLDRPTSGVTVFARTSKALERMNKLFAERKLEKVYWAVTSSRPKPIEGHLEHYILKDNQKNIVKAFDTKSSRAKNAKLATLDYELIGAIGYNFLINVKLQTGRPHQIRAQLAKIGCPIRGDIKYGHPNANADNSIHLHCRTLSFIHPITKEPISIIAEPPNDQIWKLFSGINED